ncbi:UbiD family decarboxylase [Roseomonas sp. KE2513]|uniref:UbiD family decarboxylase n=1 Tax=Roseomonas sp. KE2513 TaxID=2479202 RepID=UPI0018DF6DFF|nr:UbiD family decarboxylase [Roseomonas sp. KE2513]MBI0538206.1 UbiD family decarboxylase [Roseomonas sp. KE2513]
MDGNQQVIGEPAAASLDLDRYRLRRFLERLEAAGELQVEERPLDLADLPELLEGNPRALLARRVGPESAVLAGNVCASRTRLAHAFEVAPRDLLKEVMRRLRTSPGTLRLSRESAPVQQVVLTGEEADLTTLPVHLQHGRDGAPYISASIDYAADESRGWMNVGIRRLMLRGRREAGIDLVSPSDLRSIYETEAGKGCPLPIAFVVGCHPIDHVGATMRLPVDELGIVASLRDAPLPVVKCVTNDLLVPADAEYVLEGYLDERGHVEAEGPYGEFLGYYGGVKRNPVFHLTAITHRRDAVFQTCTIGGRSMGRTDTAQLCALRTEVMVWRALEGAVREPVGVHATGSSGGMFNLRIAIRQRVPGEARNAIMAAFGSLANVKNVFVVDPDIDIFDDGQMDWAMATRFQAGRDLITVDGLRCLPLDPSLEGARIGSKAGFDLTWSFGTGQAFERGVPAPPTYPGPRFGDIAGALADGPKFFEELMAATGSRDGREIVRALEAMRTGGGLSRDAEGRWVLGA